MDHAFFTKPVSYIRSAIFSVITWNNILAHQVRDSHSLKSVTRVNRTQIDSSPFMQLCYSYKSLPYSFSATEAGKKVIRYQMPLKNAEHARQSAHQMGWCMQLATNRCKHVHSCRSCYSSNQQALLPLERGSKSLGKGTHSYHFHMYDPMGWCKNILQGQDINSALIRAGAH